MAELTYSEILRENAALGKSLADVPPYAVAVLSNIVTAQFNAVFEHSLRRGGIPAAVTSGDYDNILQDSVKFGSVADLAIVFWEACNIRSILQARASLMPAGEIEDLIATVRSEIEFVLGNLARTPLVFFNRFSSLIFNRHAVAPNPFDRICAELNAFLEVQKAVRPNLVLVDIDRVLAEVSVPRGADFRFFYSSKSLYSVDFFRAYAEHVSPLVWSAAGKAKKALIFDCDNTLWRGVLGEDGFDGIEMSPATKAGTIFAEVQQIARDLAGKGVIIGLCSKNNPEEVDRVLTSHPDMVLRDDRIAIKKANWEDKASNLGAIARELNIGMDSLVFIDDSAFEVGLVAEAFPGLLAISVPRDLYEYPDLLRRVARLFQTTALSPEDAKRTEMYRNQAERRSEMPKFRDLEEYLASLELSVEIAIDDARNVPRLAQLTQKTNQFNLTTRRYAETDIQGFIDSPAHTVVSFSAADRFGDYGIIGLCIVRRGDDPGRAEIDTLLMSCRAIGRNIEFAFLDFLVRHLGDSGVETLDATYSGTPKNAQVADFYGKAGFEKLEISGPVESYRLNPPLYRPRNLPYIGIRHGK